MDVGALMSKRSWTANKSSTQKVQPIAACSVLFDRTSWPPVAVGTPARAASQGARINVGARMRGMWR